jgi:CspA family cold shock protein
MIGTVKLFNLKKGYGFIHADDDSFNIFVDISAVERAGMSDLKEGQRVIFESQRNERTGDMSAVSLEAIGSETTTHFDRPFPTLIAAARAATLHSAEPAER